jgi:hypothetical protein
MNAQVIPFRPRRAEPAPFPWPVSPGEESIDEMATRVLYEARAREATMRAVASFRHAGYCSRVGDHVGAAIARGLGWAALDAFEDAIGGLR